MPRIWGWNLWNSAHMFSLQSSSLLLYCICIYIMWSYTTRDVELFMYIVIRDKVAAPEIGTVKLSLLHFCWLEVSSSSGCRTWHSISSQLTWTFMSSLMLFSTLNFTSLTSFLCYISSQILPFMDYASQRSGEDTGNCYVISSPNHDSINNTGHPWKRALLYSDIVVTVTVNLHLCKKKFTATMVITLWSKRIWCPLLCDVIWKWLCITM